MNLPVDNKVNALRPSRTASLHRIGEARDDPSLLMGNVSKGPDGGVVVERQVVVGLLNRGDPTGVETPVGSQNFHSNVIILP